MISRKSVRYGVQLTATLHEAGRTHQGTVVNLSIDGCAVITETAVKAGSYWSLSVETGQTDRTIEVELAVVRWRRDGRCGMEFIRIQDDWKQHLAAFVQLLETSPPR